MVVVCRFPHPDPLSDDAAAVARFEFSDPPGCLCYPDDTVQDLCWFHARQSQPRGTMRATELYGEQGHVFNHVIGLVFKEGVVPDPCGICGEVHR